MLEFGVGVAIIVLLSRIYTSKGYIVYRNKFGDEKVIWESREHKEMMKRYGKVR